MSITEKNSNVVAPAYGQQPQTFDKQQYGYSQYSNPQGLQYSQPGTNGQPGTYGQPPVPTVAQPYPAGNNVVVANVRPKNWLLPAILSLFCFWPTAIFAIINASRANKEADYGNMQEAESKANTAKKLIIISVVIGIVLIVISVVYRIIYTVVILNS